MRDSNNGIVLIVDDEQPVRETIRKVISGFGYEAVAVDSVTAAIDCLCDHGNRIWCIITDFRMPELSGMDLIDYVKKSPLSPPVILLTAYADLELAIAAIRSGAFDFLTKPVDFHALQQAVDRAFWFSRLLMLEKEFSLELEEAVMAMTRTLSEKEQKLSDLTEQVLTVEEQERHRIATELHDNIGQALAFTKMNLLKIRFADNDTGNAALVRKAVDSLDAAIQSVRTLTTQISPPLLYEVGLEAALECLGDSLRAEHGFTVELRQCTEPLAIPEEERVVLFTAVRELLINIIKHSEVDLGIISIGDDGERIVIEVADSGTGFDDTVKTNGFGLFSIRQKMHRIGGSLAITSDVGKGTVARLVLPSVMIRETGSYDGHKYFAG